MKNGNFFKLPETDADRRLLWKHADKLYDDTAPDWIRENGEKRSDYRYLGNFSWAYVSHEKQGSPDDGWEAGTYFGELEAVSETEGFSIDGDEGDGCVVHIFLRRPTRKTVKT